VSGDTSPPSGYRLDSPSRPAGATGSVPARRAPIAVEPSWIKVIGTTLRLWVRRRILHVPDTGKIGRARGTALAAVAAVLVAAVVAGAVTAVVTLTGTPAAHRATLPRVARHTLTPAQKQARAAAARAVAANTTAAARWIAAEVSQQAVVGCDPASCAAIQLAGYSNAGQVMLLPGLRLPAAGALVVATPAVRAQYGAQLAATAPSIIAAFGDGPEVVQVRVVMAGGQAAFSQAVSSAIAARRSAATKLIGNSRVHVYPAARLALTSGMVDSRLLIVLQRLAARNSVLIYSFSDSGPGAGGSVPYRQAEIIGLTSRRAATAIAKQLLALPPRPALAIVRGPGGNFGLTLRFKAPSPG
jgi:hypothetical protein